MSIGHWLYLIGIIIVVLTMLLRRNVLIPCIIFTLLIGWSYSGSFTKGVQTVFNASLVAGQDLLSIFLIIGLMVALLKSLSVIGADEMMVVPLKKMMVSPLVSYIVLAVATFVISLFFWPTPAVPLVGALLVPVAIRAGLPPMLGAMALALAGQGMALGGDIVIQGAPGLTAAAAGVPVALVTSKAGWLSAITGIVALVLAYLFMRPEIARFQSEGEPDAELPVEPEGQKSWTESDRSKGRFLIYLLAIAMIFVIVGLFVFQLRGGDASALLGGVALSITLIAALLVRGKGGLDAIADYVADGLVFAFRVMGPIIPIAGFFFLGNPEASATILGEGAPGYLFDWGNLMAETIPPTGFLAAFGLLILGIITGLDGSGFSGLPLTGTLAGALAAGDVNVAATLGSVGQIGAIWSGGGTLVAWCSLVAVAGIVGVPVLELVRKNFLPVIIGMVVSTVVAVLFMM
ncbi:MAG TPA: hypothetical protein GX711_08660 [Clostridia bacterium]|nr:hypothetical protein [Clostridia bacterium]